MSSFMATLSHGWLQTNPNFLRIKIMSIEVLAVKLLLKCW